MNGEQVSSLSHEGALERLRRVSRGDTVHLLVSRLDAPDPPTQPASVLSRPSQKDANAFVQQIVSLSIALNDTGSAGLGVSVKGRQVPSLSSHPSTLIPEPCNARTAVEKSAGSS